MFMINYSLIMTIVATFMKALQIKPLPLGNKLGSDVNSNVLIVSLIIS